MLSANETDKEVQEYLNKIGVKVQTQLVGEFLHEDWKHDKFLVIISNTKNKTETFEYSTGIGHRVTSNNKDFSNSLSHGQKRTIKEIKEYYPNFRLLPVKHVINRHRKAEFIQTPSAASVLYSLILDADAADMNFTEWAENYDYDTDSLKALDTYNACTKIARQLQSLFTHDQKEHLQELLQDY